MTRVLFVLVLLVAGFVGLSYYLGWFHLVSGNEDGNPHITVTMDKDKIKADEKKVLDVVHPGPAKAPAPTEKSPD